jgi:hypothetical protein
MLQFLIVINYIYNNVYNLSIENYKKVIILADVSTKSHPVTSGEQQREI